MKLAVRRTTSALAVVTTAGMSTLFLGVAPAQAANPEACGTVGDLVGPGVCEAVFTSGGVFDRTPQMTTLEALLVGGGGNGVATDAPNGYAAAGGGGEVEIVNFGGATTDVTYVVGGAGSATTATDTFTNATAEPGGDGDIDSGPDTIVQTSDDVATGGDSGTPFSGSDLVRATTDPPYGAGGGAGSAASGSNGGAGVTVSSIALGGLFSGDTRCFGGGGAVGSPAGLGTPGCHAGGPTSVTSVSLPVANSGSGGGATIDPLTTTTDVSPGAAGAVIFRWNAAPVTLTFDANGHGTAPSPQVVVAGRAASRPVPIADSYAFGGWYTDASLTTAADFSSIPNSTTFYAKWTPALAASGSELDPAVLPLGLTALMLGTGLVMAASRRHRRAD